MGACQDLNKEGLKDLNLRLITELMRNSRRSDRELAKALGVSQPTVSRIVRRLEQEGYIKEYTMIPDFGKIGFQILAFSFYKLIENVPPQDIEKRRKFIREDLRKEPMPHILGMSGMGLGADRVIVTFHEDYASYLEFLARVRRNPFIKAGRIDSFMVSLADTNHFSNLTFLELADYMQKRNRSRSQN